MGTKMKGIYKGFKYSLAQIFVVKEDSHEIVIGNPTDVKHVAHIGWDGPSGSTPAWMNEFNTGPDYAASSIGNSGSVLSPWSSQDMGDESSMRQTGSEIFNNIPTSELPPSIKKKQKRRKPRTSTSSPKSSTSSSRSTRAPKSKAKLVEDNAKPPANIEVN